MLCEEVQVLGGLRFPDTLAPSLHLRLLGFSRLLYGRHLRGDLPLLQRADTRTAYAGTGAAGRVQWQVGDAAHGAVQSVWRSLRCDWRAGLGLR
jgi:hypothetical protein